MTDKQPEALALADWLDTHSNGALDARRQAAALLRAQHKQLAAYKLLTESQEAQLSQHRAQADKYREAVATLQSERDANALLTAAIEHNNAQWMERIAALEAQLKLPAEDLLPTLTPAGQQWADEQVAFAERLKKAEGRVVELEAQVQALSLDAGRYAYLSRQMGTLCITNADENTGPVFKAAAADSHIDAAIQKATHKEQT